jgi:tetratricopeptide (TPR) repeat protein
LPNFIYAPQGRVAKVQAHLETAGRVNANQVNVNLALVDVYLAQRRPDDAIAKAQAVIKADPKVAAAYRIMGAANLEKSKIDTAIVELQKAAALDPKSAAIQLNLGEAYQRKGSTDQATTAYCKA